MNFYTFRRKMRRCLRRAADGLRIVGMVLTVAALGAYGTHGLDPREMVAPCHGAAQCIRMGATTPFDITQKSTADAVTSAVGE